MRYTSRQSGFTLIEIVLVIALSVIVMGATIPLYMSFSASHDLLRASDTIPFAVRNARIRSEGLQENSAWSVHVDSGVVTVYKGTNFAGRDQSKDETYEIAESIVISGSQDIHLQSLTGLPEQAYSLQLRARNNKTKNITINAQGAITVE